MDRSLDETPMASPPIMRIEGEAVSFRDSISGILSLSGRDFSNELLANKT
jgi:hypothetical protein